ncbi:MAG: hypothetical protein AAF409_19340 [Pseudomonadota bacterium]
MIRMLSAMLCALLFAGSASAQQVNVSGTWRCTVNAQSSDPASNYGLEVDVQIAPNGQLSGRGVVIYPQLSNPFTQIQGFGDWSVLPSDNPANAPLVKMRLQPQAGNHPIVSWFARPAGQGRMYNLFQGTAQNGHQVQVETQCMRM